MEVISVVRKYIIKDLTGLVENSNIFNECTSGAGRTGKDYYFFVSLTTFISSRKISSKIFITCSGL